ncbi:unnamed protein product [Leptidea sinapis]|uniref:BED-type domain-containing protein n=1 Tax=Leptidea sinapis TaxID=189913 RepID=A0A5E4QH85_9NEOP|nr:unnamed protein product [Leptidea sinapis]
MTERKRSSPIWQYFERIGTDKKALCCLCNKSLSYKTTIANLKSHLKLKHFATYTTFVSKKPRIPQAVGRCHFHTHHTHFYCTQPYRKNKK